MAGDDVYPEIVTKLPRADLHGDGVRTYLLQAENMQVAFVAFDEDINAPEESHPAQWVVVLEGEVELTMGGETTAYRRGDNYFVPAGVPHVARIKTGSRLLDLFDQADRFHVS